MVELPVERRPSVHQDETRKPAVGFHRQRKPAVLSPVTIEPLVGEPTIGANFAIARSDFRKFREIVFIKLHQIRDNSALALGDLSQCHAIDHAILHRAPPRRGGYTVASCSKAPFFAGLRSTGCPRTLSSL